MINWFKDLIRDSLVYGLGFGISRSLQIFVLPIIAKSLSLNEYGYYSNYVIFYTIAGGVFLLGMDNSVARFFYDSKEKLYHQKIFSIAFFCILLTSFIAAVCFSFFPSFLLKITSVPVKYSEALPYVLFTFPMLVLNNFFLSWFKYRRQKYFFVLNSIGSVIFLLIPLVIAQVMHNVTFHLIFKIIFYSQFLIVIISLILTTNYIRFVFDKILFWEMFKYGLPWMLVFFFGLSRSYLDRIFLNHYLNDEMYGVYNFSVRLSTIISVVISAFSMSFGPLAFSIWKKKNAPEFFARLQSGYILFISIIASVISVISPVIVTILGGTKYSGAERVLPFLLFSAIPLSLVNFSNLGTMYAKRPHLNSISLIMGFITVLLLNFIITPLFFQYGAVNASIVGHLVIVCIGYYFSQKFYKIPFRFTKDGIILTLFLAFSIAVVNIDISTNSYKDCYFKLFVLLVLSFIIFYFFFKNEYLKILGLIKQISG